MQQIGLTRVEGQGQAADPMEADRVAGLLPPRIALQRIRHQLQPLDL